MYVPACLVDWLSDALWSFAQISVNGAKCFCCAAPQMCVEVNILFNLERSSGLGCLKYIIFKQGKSLC